MLLLTFCKKEKDQDTPTVTYLKLYVAAYDTNNAAIPMTNTPITIYGEKYTGFTGQTALYTGTTDDSGNIKIPEDSLKNKAILENQSYKIYVVAQKSGAYPMATRGQNSTSLSQKLFFDPGTGKYKYDTAWLSYDLLGFLTKYDKWVFLKSYAGGVLLPDSLIKACSKDNYLSFAFFNISLAGQVNVKIQFNEGALICDSSKTTSSGFGLDCDFSFLNHRFFGSLCSVFGDAGIFGNSPQLTYDNDTIKLTGTFYTPSVYQSTTYFIPVK